MKGKPEEVFTELFKTHDVKIVTVEHDTGPYSKKRDEVVKQLCSEHKVKFESFVSHTLFDLDEFTEMPKTYQSFLKLLKKPAKPIDTFDGWKVKDFKQTINLGEGVPNLTDTFEYKGHTPTKLFLGGESAGLEVLQNYLKNKKKVLEFEKPKTNPCALEPDTTALSPYLKFGCVSVRKLWWDIQKVYDTGKHSSPPESLHGQLYFREYFYLAGHVGTNFAKMEGNPDCKQIPWGNDSVKLKAWEDGMTGFPAVDAVMRQLNQEGWIHHLGRHLVACFLTRGDLWIHWEQGAKVFDRLLLDADWSLNNANWQWLSASRFFQQYFKVYSPVSFFQKSDPNGLYIKKYCPELSKYPPELIFSPWLASAEQQKKYGCIIGKDYPMRIVDHDIVRVENLEKMRMAYNPNRKEEEK